MATRRKITKQPARRKAAEPEEVERDLTDEGNPAELEGPGESGEIVKDEAPFEPKGSMTEAAKAFANLKAIKDYFGEGGEGDLRKMDHPGMREGLSEMFGEGGPGDQLMESLKALMHEHHGKDYGLEPDELMQKSVEHLDGTGAAPYDKSVEPLEPDAPTTEIKDDSFEQGEANLVDSGVIPEGDLDEKGELVDWAEQEEAEHGLEGKQHGSDQDTEEIIERYQHPKTGQWANRVVGKAWRAKNGRIYCKVNKDLTDPGNPAELTEGGGHHGDTIIKDEHLDAIGKAADHLDAMAAGYSASPETHGQHAEALRGVHRDLSDMGNPEELKDGPDGAEGPAPDLTEGVEELKDVDEEEPVKAAKPQRAKGVATFDDGMKRQLRDALEQSRKNREEMQRKARLLNIPINGN